MSGDLALLLWRLGLYVNIVLSEQIRDGQTVQERDVNYLHSLKTLSHMADFSPWVFVVIHRLSHELVHA